MTGSPFFFFFFAQNTPDKVLKSVPLLKNVNDRAKCFQCTGFLDRPHTANLCD